MTMFYLKDTQSYNARSSRECDIKKLESMTCLSDPVNGYSDFDSICSCLYGYGLERGRRSIVNYKMRHIHLRTGEWSVDKIVTCLCCNILMACEWVGLVMLVEESV